MIDASIYNNLRPPQFADPLEQVGKALNLQAARQQIQMGPLRQQEAQEQLRGAQMENQQRQLQIDQTKALNTAYQGALTVGDDGTPTIDTGKLTQALGLAGHGSAIPGVLKGVVDFQKSSADLAKLNGEVAEKQADYGGIVGATVKAANYDPQLFLVKAQHALASKALPPATVQPFLQQVSQALQQDPTGETARGLVQKISDSLIAGSPAQQKLINEAATAKAHTDEAATAGQRLTAELPGLQAKSAIEAASAAALRQMTRGDWDNALASTVTDQNSPLYKRTQATVNLSLSRGDLKGAQQAIKDAGDQLGRTETAVATAKATAPIKIDVATATAAAKADAAGLTEDDYSRLGEQYGRTGVMPSMGRDSITRGKIAHAAQEWARDNGYKPADMVTMQAAYAGDKDSLKKFQTQRDQIVSFEQTATKNLDLMLQKAQPLVDSGSPLLNRPWRSIQRTALGSTDQAAFDAAFRVANNEVAKVTQGGGLSGVVSDSARKEIEQANSPSATLGQLIAAAKVLKVDMANRHGSMDATLSDIKSRIGGGSGAAPQATTVLPQVGHVVSVGGKKIKITVIHGDGSFDGDEVKQ